MKAVILNGYGDTSNFKTINLPKPKVSDHEVLVRIKAANF